MTAFSATPPLYCSAFRASLRGAIGGTPSALAVGTYQGTHDP